MRQYHYRCRTCRNIYISHEMNLRGWCNRQSCKESLNKTLSDGTLSPVLMDLMFSEVHTPAYFVTPTIRPCVENWFTDTSSV